MSTYDALDALEAKIHANRTDFAARAARINADADYTPDARRRRIQDEHIAATERHQALAAEHRALKARTAENLRRRAFSAVGNAPASTVDQVAVRSAYSQSIERAQQAENSADLRRLLGVARTAGDNLLASAVAVTAHERGFGDVLDAYLEDHPERRAAIEAYEDFMTGRGNQRASLEDRLRLSGPAVPHSLM